MNQLQFVTRLISFFIHLALTAAIIDKMGEMMSDQINILLVIGLGVAMSVLVILMLYHLVALIKLYRKLTTKTKEP